MEYSESKKKYNLEYAKKKLKRRAEPSEYSGSDGTWPADPESFCAEAWLCLRGCGLFPDRASCAGTSFQR